MERPSTHGDLGTLEIAAAPGLRWSAVDSETCAYVDPVTILSRDLAHLLHDRAVVLAEIERVGASPPMATSRGPWLFSVPAASSRQSPQASA